MEILLAALVAAAVSGGVALLAPRLRHRPALVDGTQAARSPGTFEQTRRRTLRELERAAELPVAEARQALLAELEEELRHERARLIRHVEEETRHDAERRARSILATCMQRIAGSHAAETTVTAVQLDSDELKGRIIGREGRNIRALQTLTGIDVIVDDTPGTVMLSGFDGVRREVARLTLEKLGADPKVAARAALLHDVGKAVSHEVDGPHALVGGELARRHGESDAVAHAVEAHHDEIEPRTVEAVIVQIADALSGARPGARGESLEHYVARLHDLEGVATRHAGVEKVYAMHAGRELRVIVKPEEIDDDGATILSREIAREVERELEYPGQVKVTVIRERRAVDIAR
jgi:putative nucleotidyltransferase with HDIG domain